MDHDEEEQVRSVLLEWSGTPDQPPAHRGVLDQTTLRSMAELAVRVLTPGPPECGATHPQRPWITCGHDQGHAVPQAHRNERLGLDWNNDGSTIHDELGDIELVYAEPDPEQSSTDGDPTLARDMVRALMAARRALAEVDEKYTSDSQRITAPLVRSVRSAMHTADLVMDAAGAAVGQEYVTP